MGFILYWQNKIVASSSSMGKGLKIMISGAPASGKGTQCELITTKVSPRFFTFTFTSYFTALDSLLKCERCQVQFVLGAVAEPGK